MSEDASSGKEDDVVARAEAELKSRTLEEPDWDAMAERVLSALPQAGATESTLLEAPLPTQADEVPLDLASSTRVRGTEPSIELGSQDATLEDAWAELPASGMEEPPFTAVASMPYVATETAVTESGIVETGAARKRVERSGERELVSLDELIPEHARGRNEIVPPSGNDATGALSVRRGEPATSEEAPESRREAVSLADLARSSVSRRSEDVSSIAKESIAVARTHTGVARRVHAADAAANLPSVVIAPSAVDPPTEPPARAPAATNQGPIIGAAIAIMGLAAGFAFYIAGQRPADPLVVTQVVPAAAPPAALGEAPAAAKPVTPERAGPVTTAGPSPEATATSERATALAPLAGGAARSAKSGAPLASSGVVPEKVVLNEDEPGVRAEKVVLDEDPGAPAPSKGAPSAESPALRPAVSHGTGGLPDRPSSGAVQAAVGAVLGAARSCLAGQLEPSNARVVFGSDGSVQAVHVSGPAAGTPAASCIESAFKKARVQPFAAPSLSFGTKVRPP